MKSKKRVLIALVSMICILILGVAICIICKLSDKSDKDVFGENGYPLYDMDSLEGMRFGFQTADSREDKEPALQESCYYVIDSPNIKRFVRCLNAIEAVRCDERPRFRQSDVAIDLFVQMESSVVEVIRIMKEVRHNKCYIETFGSESNVWEVVNPSESCDYFFEFYEDVLHNGEITIGNKLDKDANPNGSYLLSGNTEILTPYAVDRAEMGFGNPSAKAGFDRKDESECVFVEDKKIIEELLNEFDKFYATEIEKPRDVTFDKSIELLVESNNHKSHNIIRIKYNSNDDEYIIQTFWAAGSWWRVIEGKDSCKKLFEICEELSVH